MGIIAIGLISTVILNFTRAKYRTTESIPLVNGTINYTPYDFKMVAMYQENESGEYEKINQIPTSGYTLNTEQSYCEVNNEKDNSIPMSYDDGRVYVGVNTTGTKCYLYFDEYVPSAKDIILADQNTILTRDDFSIDITETTAGIVYKSLNDNQYDNDGEVYYFAGYPTNNWLIFGGFYWRIIRINGDDSIRIIYQGTEANTTGANTQISTSAFNSSFQNNMYVGYMYQNNEVHGLSSSSTIKEVLDTWYRDNLATNYGNKIDGNAGFCGDRIPSTNSSSSNGQGGTGTAETFYNGYIRLYSHKTPSFKCNNDDLYTTHESSKGNKALTYPIGLISADEVAYAGGTISGNNNYYLYTGEDYWTMTPSVYNGNARDFYITSGRNFNVGNMFAVFAPFGVRPVINLKADVQITGGNGSSTNPYKVN